MRLIPKGCYLLRLKKNQQLNSHVYLIYYLSAFALILLLPYITLAVETYPEGYSNLNISLKMNTAGQWMIADYAIISGTEHLDGDNNDQGSFKVAGFKTLEPRKAFLRAVFPGFLFHGAGHQYVGQPGNGFLLLSAEIVSVPLIIIGAHIQAFDDDPDTKTLGDLYTKSYFGFFGLNLFFGSWIYDMVAAPIKAKKYNQKHRLALRLTPTENGRKLLCTFSF